MCAVDERVNVCDPARRNGYFGNRRLRHSEWLRLRYREREQHSRRECCFNDVLHIVNYLSLIVIKPGSLPPAMRAGGSLPEVAYTAASRMPVRGSPWAP